MLNIADGRLTADGPGAALEAYMAEPSDKIMTIEEKMADLSGELYAQIAEGAFLDVVIRKNLEALGHDE